MYSKDRGEMMEWWCRRRRSRRFCSLLCAGHEKSQPDMLMCIEYYSRASRAARHTVCCVEHKRKMYSHLIKNNTGANNAFVERLQQQQQHRQQWKETLLPPPPLLPCCPCPLCHPIAHSHNNNNKYIYIHVCTCSTIHTQEQHDNGCCLWFDAALTARREKRKSRNDK